MRTRRTKTSSLHLHRVRADLADVDLSTVRAAAATGDVDPLIRRAELAERQRQRSAERAQREAAERVRAAELQSFREAREARRAPGNDAVQRAVRVTSGVVPSTNANKTGRQ